MGRYSTLNADTKDLVNCLLPALAASFGLSNPIDIIPEDIRMRAWDCERRDHIKDQPEDDPCNWGVQFLKDLKAISRLKDGNLAVFQADLRAKVELHEEKHPWCRLSDIKELKAEYENPELLRKDTQSDEFESESSIDSYLEELHEPELPRGKKRKGGHEFYETRVQQKQRKYGRLRRTEDGAVYRKDISRKKPRPSTERSSALPNSSRLHNRSNSRVIASDREESFDSAGAMFLPSFSTSPGPRSLAAHSVETAESLAVQRMQAELEVAEAELKTARLKMQVLQAREADAREAERQRGAWEDGGSGGSGGGYDDDDDDDEEEDV